VGAEPLTLGRDFPVFSFPHFLAIVGTKVKMFPPLPVPKVAEFYAKAKFAVAFSAPFFH
jgi:hypothetical protein